MAADDLTGRLDKVYQSRDLAQLEEAYDAWADTYDSEVSRLGYLLRVVSTGYICRYVSPDDRVLDAGAGTGLIGSYLSAMRFHDLTAIDLSAGMLGFAEEKGCYREIRRMVLGEPLDYSRNSFDAVYAIGVFTEGHAPPDSLYELTRVVRPGGFVIFSIRNDVYHEWGYKEVQDDLEANGVWRETERSPRFQPYEQTRPDIQHRVFVYQIEK